MKYELSDIIKNNLLEFLKRVQLSGQEVPAYCDIVVALNNPIKDEPEQQTQQ